MPLKPIDMQVMMPKMTEIAMAQGSEGQRRLASSHHTAEQTRRMVDATTREVRQKADVARVTFMEHGDEGGADAGSGGKGGKGRRGSRGQKGAPGQDAPLAGIDVRL